MTKPIISVDNLSKAYRIGAKEVMPDTLVGAAKGIVKSPLKNLKSLRSLDTTRSNQDEGDPGLLWALKDVSFEVSEGEVIAIIGRNGAGKSTLLKVLSRITEPTSGRAVLRGRVSSLLEVGTGFHPELTGRENIYMNGTILGMTKREIDRKFDEIVDFSGIEKFLDTPTKRYSSGMQVRLAFAVAAHLEPEILIIDEVLAVGDAHFQKKCLGAMEDVANSGRTVLFVSHNMGAVQRLCRRSVLIDNGQVALDARTEDVVPHYFSVTGSGDCDLSELPRKKKRSPVLKRIRFFDESGKGVETASPSSPLEIELEYSHLESLQNPSFGMLWENEVGQRLFFLKTGIQQGDAPDLPKSGCVRFQIPSLPLMPGHYYLSLGCTVNGVQLDALDRVVMVTVSDGDPFGTGAIPQVGFGPMLVDCDWEFS